MKYKPAQNKKQVDCIETSRRDRDDPAIRGGRQIVAEVISSDPPRRQAADASQRRDAGDSSHVLHDCGDSQGDDLT